MLELGMEQVALWLDSLAWQGNFVNYSPSCNKYDTNIDNYDKKSSENSFPLHLQQETIIHALNQNILGNFVKISLKLYFQQPAKV